MDFYIAASIVFWVLFIIWTKDDLHNLCLKALFFLMAGWSTFLLLKDAGYVVKLTGI